MLTNSAISPERKLALRLFFKYQLWQYLLVISSICVCSFIFDKWIEGIAFTIAHLSLRYKFNRVFHSRNYCLQLTLFIVWCCIPITLPMGLSLLSSIPIAFFVCWVGNLAEDRKVLAKKNKKLIIQNEDFKEKLKPKPFSVDTCTEQELIERCREIGLSEFNTELAIEFFIKKTKHSILADRLCIAEKSAIAHKCRLKNKLNIPQ